MCSGVYSEHRVQFSHHILFLISTTTMSINKQKNFIGGAAVHKELQGFAAFVAYQNCHESGGSVTRAMLESSIGKQYFGDPRDPDSIGLAEQLVEGTGVFSALLYDSGGSLGFASPLRLHQTSTNRASASSAGGVVIRNSTAILKPSLHSLGGHIAIPVGGVNGITLPLLLQSKLTVLSAKKNGSLAAQQEQDDYIKPRTLFTRAQEIVKNGKKALSCVMAQDSPYRDYVKTGNLPSGMNHDDYLQLVHEKMFAALNPPKQVQDSDDLNNLDAGSADTSPTTNSSSMEVDADSGGKMFTFAGYIVFTLMGPIVENFDMLHYRSNLLMTSTPTYSSTAEKKLAGRNDSRALQSDMKRKHRRDTDDEGNSSKLTRTTAPDVVDLSVATLSECIQAVGIAQSRLAERGKEDSESEWSENCYAPEESHR